MPAGELRELVVKSSALCATALGIFYVFRKSSLAGKPDPAFKPGFPNMNPRFIPIPKGGAEALRARQDAAAKLAKSK